MYLGKIVEIGPTEEILAHPMHPYTKALLSAVPVPDPSIRRTPVEIKGGISKAINPPPECRFIERCPFAAEVCRTNPHPPLERERRPPFRRVLPGRRDQETAAATCSVAARRRGERLSPRTR